jgi:hypothetical protein
MDPKFIESRREQHNSSIGMDHSDVLGEEAEPDLEQAKADMD